MEFTPWGQKAKEPDQVETATAVAHQDPLDPQPHIKRLNAAFKPEFEKLEVQAAEITVIGDESNELAVQMMNQLDRFRIDLEKHRKNIVAAPTLFNRNINSFTKDWTDKAMVLKKKIKVKVSTYMFQKEKERKEKEAKRIAEAERLRKEQEAKHQAEVDKAIENLHDPEAPVKDSLPPPPLQPPPQVPRSTKTETATGTASVKKVWKWAIVNFKDLPDECFAERAELIENAVAPWINTRIKAGLKVPGVDSWQEDDLKTSTKRK